MSASLTSPKEISSLLKLVSAALDNSSDYSHEEIGEMIDLCDRTAATIDAERETTGPHFYIGLHTHRHGVSNYLFRTAADVMTMADFEAFLGEDYEPDRDDEWLDLDGVTPIDLTQLDGMGNRPDVEPEIIEATEDHNGDPIGEDANEGYAE